MKKNLSAIGLLWISLTSIIGSGWLFGSLYSAHFAGPAAIIAWPLAGILLLFVALSFAEVATMFPQEGTLARLPLYTHGHLISIIMSGLAWISLATIPVIETQGLIQYASNYLPHLVSHHGIHYVTTPRGYLMALILLMSFVLLNYFGIRLFARINAWFTVWKIFIPVLTVILLLGLDYHAKDFSSYGGFMPYGMTGVMAAMSNGGVLFSLLGFRQVVIMMSQIDNPGKYVPIVLISSLIITTLIYTALQWAFIGAIQEQDLVKGWKHLFFPGDAGPFAALASIAGIVWLSGLLYVDAFISPYSTGLVYSTTAAYMLASMSSMGNMPKKFAELNQYQVPWICLGINFLIAAMMFFILRDWQAMASFLVAVMMVSYAIGPICLVCLRSQIPHHIRPFRLRYHKTISFIGFYVCTAGVYWAGLVSLLKLLTLVLVGLSFYLFYIYVIKKSQQKIDGKYSTWLLCYLIGLSIFSYLGNYGGKHIIPNYWDLLYLLGFSFIIFYLAFVCKKPSAHTQEQIKLAEKFVGRAVDRPYN